MRSRRTLFLGAGVLAILLLAVLAIQRLFAPAKLGLDRPRIVLVSGDASVDADRARAALPFARGATVHTGHGSVCFSVHASRICIGANAEVRLAAIEAHGGGTLEVHRGTVVAGAAAGEEIHLVLNGVGTVTVRGATVALEDTTLDPTLRALVSSATVELVGRPALVVVAPDSIALRDGRRRGSASPALEKEESSVVQLARRWQGSAGAVLSYSGLHGRVEIDGADVGTAPAAVLLDEGAHTLIVREGSKELVDERLTLKAGQKVDRGD